MALSHVPCAPFGDLVRLGFATAEDATRVVQFGVREDEEATVHRAKGGPFFLSFIPGKDKNDYEGRDDLRYWSNGDYDAALKKCHEDDFRRAQDFYLDIAGADSWLDFGAGLGGVVLQFFNINNQKGRGIEDKSNDQKKDKGEAEEAAEAEAEAATNGKMRIGVVEVQRGALEALNRHLKPKGVEIFSGLEDIPTGGGRGGEVDKIDEGFQIVTLFHVMEHLENPVEILAQIKDKMATGGKLIVEVPHAGDALISSNHFDCEAFRKFTFWKEHLVLHTKQSLTSFIEAAGFKVEKVIGYQRYPLANHVCWLAEGKPGGHVKRDWLRDQKTEDAYAAFLDSMDATDTIIATAIKP